MFYRVVMQGRTLGNADIVDVKRDFIRITGVPERVAEQLFSGMPRVIKRQVPQSDAERIAATLRAIGAAATVERELLETETESADEIRIVASPFNGPPSIIPGTEAPAPDIAPVSQSQRLLRVVREWWREIAIAIVLIAGGIPLAPIAIDIASNMNRRPAPAPAAAKPVVAKNASAAVPTIEVTHLQGPWRCTDQRTGVSTYWSYRTDGTLVFHGESLKEGPAETSPGAPTAWKLDGQRLRLISDGGAPETLTVAELTLSRLRYGNDHGLNVECRRP